MLLPPAGLLTLTQELSPAQVCTRGLELLTGTSICVFPGEGALAAVPLYPPLLRTMQVAFLPVQLMPLLMTGAPPPLEFEGCAGELVEGPLLRQVLPSWSHDTPPPAVMLLPPPVSMASSRYL